jgi:hypothetical protein
MSRGSKPIDESSKFDSPFGHVRDRIVIHQGEDIPKEGIFLSLNGYPFQVKPGEEIDLPRPVRNMLDTMIKTETTQGEDGKKFYRDIPRFTYTLIKEGVNLDESGNVINAGASQEVSALP